MSAGRRERGLLPAAAVAAQQAVAWWWWRGRPPQRAAAAVGCRCVIAGAAVGARLLLLELHLGPASLRTTLCRPNHLRRFDLLVPSNISGRDPRPRAVRKDERRGPSHSAAMKPQKGGGGPLKPILFLVLCGAFAAWFYELFEFSSEAAHHNHAHHAHHESAPRHTVPVHTTQEAPLKSSEQPRAAVATAAYEPIQKRYWHYRRDVAEFLQRHFSAHRDVPAPVPPVAKTCRDGTSALPCTHSRRRVLLIRRPAPRLGRSVPIPPPDHEAPLPSLQPSARATASASRSPASASATRGGRGRFAMSQSSTAATPPRASGSSPAAAATATCR